MAADPLDIDMSAYAAVDPEAPVTKKLPPRPKANSPKKPDATFIDSAAYLVEGAHALAAATLHPALEITHPEAVELTEKTADVARAYGVPIDANPKLAASLALGGSLLKIEGPRLKTALSEPVTPRKRGQDKETAPAGPPPSLVIPVMGYDEGGQNVGAS